MTNQNDLFGEEKSANDWFSDWWLEFWNTYPNKKPLCYKNYGKGSQEQAEKTARNKIKTKQKADSVLLSLREQIKFAKAEVDAGIDKHLVFPMCATWLNQARWSIELGSYVDVAEQKKGRELKQCNYSGCKEQVHGLKYDQCYKHLKDPSEHQKEVNNTLKKYGLEPKPGQSKEEHLNKLKQFSRAGFRALRNQIIER